jgi:hypothetical protein
MTEVGGDAARYFDPKDARSAARIIADALPHAAQIRRDGIEHAAQWSTTRMIAGYEEQYSTLAQ